MLNRFATLAACALMPLGTAPIALADPSPAANPEPTPDNGVVVSNPPGVVTSPDGWVLNVAASDETQLPVAPLTTATSSREYLVGGTFTGTVTGVGKTSLHGGTLEAGYQIGCGIDLAFVELLGQAGVGLTDDRSDTNGRQLPDLRHDRSFSEAWHGLHRHRRQEVLQGRTRARHSQGHPHQGRRLRRSVVPAVVRNADQRDDRHRRRRRLLRRDQGRLTSSMDSNQGTMSAANIAVTG